MFAVSLGLMAVIPTLGLYIEERFQIRGQQLQAWTGMIYAAGPLTAAFLGPIWGALGDRVGRKIMVVRAGLAIGLVCALMPLATSLYWLLLLRVAQGAFAGYVAPALVLGTMGVERKRQGLRLARLQLALAMGLLAGPPVGAEVVALLGRSSVFYMTSIFSFLSTLPVIFLVREDRSTLAAAPETSLVRALGEDLWAMLSSKSILFLLLVIFLMRFGQHMVEPYVAFWVRDLGPLSLAERFTSSKSHAVDRTIALAFAILALAQLGLTTTWGRLADRYGPLRILATIALGLAVVFFLTSRVETIDSFILLRCCAALFMAGSMTLAYASAARRISPEKKALAFALVQSCMQLGLSLGPVAGQAVVGGSVKSITSLYLFGGICLAVAGLGMILLRFLGVRARRAAAQPAAEEQV